jgi:arsenite methyltransferase
MTALTPPPSHDRGVEAGSTLDPVTSRAAYGVDAPGVPKWLTIGGGFLLALAVVNAILGVGTGAVLGPLLAALWLLGGAALYLHTSLSGKFAVWTELLDGLELRGDEKVLDLGCGRGAVLLAAAQRLPHGRAVGVDLWRNVDQSGNAEEATEANAMAEGVADRVELRTGDMTELPFDDASFDLVLSSLAIHNIDRAAGRRKAIEEAVRVLRPGGRLVVADIQHTVDYATQLRLLGMTEVVRRPLGWRFWYGGPWMATSVVTASRPKG